MIAVIRNKIGLLSVLALVFPLYACADDGSSSLRIASANMEPSIPVGSTVSIDESAYRSARPKHGDVIIFRRPDDPRTSGIDESKQKYLSRVIATPGDSIAVQAASVERNGKPLQEDYAKWSRGGWKDFPQVTVPEKSVFVLGDNRDFSKDSRFFSEVFVSYGDILGRASFD